MNEYLALDRGRLIVVELAKDIRDIRGEVRLRKCQNRVRNVTTSQGNLSLTSKLINFILEIAIAASDRAGCHKSDQMAIYKLALR